VLAKALSRRAGDSGADEVGYLAAGWADLLDESRYELDGPESISKTVSTWWI